MIRIATATSARVTSRCWSDFKPPTGSSCLSTAHAELVFKDDSCQEIRLKAPAKRIVTLAPHATEILYAAAAGSRLAALRNDSANKPLVRVFYQIWKASLMAVGGPQIIGEATGLCADIARSCRPAGQRPK